MRINCNILTEVDVDPLAFINNLIIKYIGANGYLTKYSNSPYVVGDTVTGLEKSISKETYELVESLFTTRNKLRQVMEKEEVNK